MSHDSLSKTRASVSEHATSRPLVATACAASGATRSRTGLAALLAISSLAFAGPRLEVAPQKHDFGKVFQGATVEHSFRVKNVGDARLKIERTRGSCVLCATSMLKATTLGPGEGDRLVVSYHAKGKLGPRTACLWCFAGRRPRKHRGASYGGVRARPLGDLVLLPGAGGRFVSKLMIENELDREIVVVFPPDGTSLGRARPARVSLAPGRSAAVDIEVVPDQVGRASTIRVDVCPLWIGKMKRKDAEARTRKGR